MAAMGNQVTEMTAVCSSDKCAVCSPVAQYICQSKAAHHMTRANLNGGVRSEGNGKSCHADFFSIKNHVTSSCGKFMSRRYTNP
jgi:hypothetical protein